MPDTTTLIITRCEEKSGEVLVYGRETSDPDTAERLLFTKKGRLRAFSQTQVAVEFYDGATEYYDARGAMGMPDFTANGAADQVRDDRGRHPHHRRDRDGSADRIKIAFIRRPLFFTPK